MTGALQGIRVLDLTQIMAGPFCTMLLADLGAEVIKVERPQGGDDARRMGPPFYDGESAAFIAMNRNKKSLALDIKTPAGQDILWKLIDSADVLVENFRPGTMARLGFGYEEVRGRRPGLVYCSISAYGQTGPLATGGGFDLIAQAMSGVISVTGTPETPVKVGVPISDLNAGLFASHAVLAAIIHRARTGEGQHVETSLLEAALAYTIWESNEYWATGGSPRRLGTAHRLNAPYQLFETADGWIAIGAANQRNWERLCAAMDRHDLLKDARFASNSERMAHLSELIKTMSPTFRERRRDDWLEVLEAAGVPAGPMLSLEQVYEHPHVQAREMKLEVEHPTAGRVHAIGMPVKYSATPGRIARAAPLLGQHSHEVLASLGLSGAQLGELEREGVVHQGMKPSPTLPKPGQG
ncbi:MAG: CoA transferase [Deinococcota bacterium]|nr:CoA transferase [Deinococcota bacterium]